MFSEWCSVKLSHKKSVDSFVYDIGNRWLLQLIQIVSVPTNLFDAKLKVKWYVIISNYTFVSYTFHILYYLNGLFCEWPLLIFLLIFEDLSICELYNYWYVWNNDTFFKN